MFSGREVEPGNDEDVDRLDGLDAGEHATRGGDAMAWRDDDGSERSGLPMDVHYVGAHGEQIQHPEDLRDRSVLGGGVSRRALGRSSRVRRVRCAEAVQVGRRASTAHPPTLVVPALNCPPSV
jgi:hypothetical protein